MSGESSGGDRRRKDRPFPVESAPGVDQDTVRVWVSRTAGHERRHARVLLLTAAADLLGTPATDLRIGYEPDGRPVLAGTNRDIHVSVSHGRRINAVAVTRLGPVGVDVEAVRPLPAVALARRWLTPEEARWVQRRLTGEQVPAFLWLWTLKEAIGKSRGLGLRRGGLQQPVPLPEPWAPPAALVLVPIPGEAGVATASLVRDGSVLALACAAPVNRAAVQIREA